MKNSRQLQKIHDEHARVFTHTQTESSPVVFTKTNESSFVNKQKQTEISQRPSKEPQEEGGILILDKPDKSFREILQKSRTIKNIKQSELAKTLNVKSNIINDWENGKTVPTPQQKAQLSKALGVKFPKQSKK
tara:strand:+ start:2394 stop:2792 length:399 start_codon:yes stop_codon:yes gene_type:complete